MQIPMYGKACCRSWGAASTAAACAAEACLAQGGTGRRSRYGRCQHCTWRPRDRVGAARKVLSGVDHCMCGQESLLLDSPSLQLVGWVTCSRWGPPSGGIVSLLQILLPFNIAQPQLSWSAHWPCSVEVLVIHGRLHPNRCILQVLTQPTAGAFHYHSIKQAWSVHNGFPANRVLSGPLLTLPLCRLESRAAGPQNAPHCGSASMPPHWCPAARTRGQAVHQQQS